GRPTPRAGPPSLLAPLGPLDVERVLDRLRLRAARLGEGHPDDPRVERERPVVDVPGVEPEALLPGDLVAAHHLRPAGDPGLDGQAPPVLRLVVRDLLDEIRARADEAHLAAQHVPELRQLVEACPGPRA